LGVGDVEGGSFDCRSRLGFCDKLEEGGKQFLLGLRIELRLVFFQLQRCLAVLDIERQFDSIQIRFGTGITTQGSVKCPDHSAGEAFADLQRDHFGCSRFTLSRGAHVGTGPALLEAGATHSAFIDKLQRPDLRV
jgi:hypothetical protein